MNIDFALLLVILVFLTGIVWLIDSLFFARQRRQTAENSQVAEPKIVEYARAFFPILLVVLLLRSFLYEPFRIPSGSLEPTLLVGDFIVVNKFTYGLRWPVLNEKFIPINEPQIGDITVFRWPLDSRINYIKRVVGVAGDHISYIDKVLYINGKKMSQTRIGPAIDNEQGRVLQVIKYRENLNGVNHEIYVRPDVPARDFRDIVVPPGHYFMMGDNRDSSSDSRFWGFVPEKDLVGKAVAIWFSWAGVQSSLEGVTHLVRWGRLGKSIH